MRFLLTALAFSLLSACATAPAPDTRLYNLTIIVPGPMGMPVPIGSMQVRHPQRHADGSLCFDRVENSQYGCVKLFQYDLSEAESK